ncbi:hypothetical protein MRX96_050762 [Rhipicephalus microplus]
MDIAYFFFPSLDGLPVLVRLPRTDDDRLLGAIRGFPCLPPCLEDERLRVWRRFLPRFERRLMVEEDVMDRTWRWLLVRLFRGWLASDDAEERPRPRSLRAGPKWRLCDECLDRPRLTFLDGRRFRPSLAVSFGLFEGTSFGSASYGGFSGPWLPPLCWQQDFCLWWRHCRGLAQLSSRRGCNGRRCERPIRTRSLAVGHVDAW